MPVRLGASGLEVSAVCLGCMGFGEPGRGTHPWTLDEPEARTVIQHALESGITFFDTANTYSDGSSEEILGRALADFARRDEVVISTKVGLPTRPGPNGRGLSRKAVLTEVEASLRRLGTDYIDVYQMHRWDPVTPIEETLDVLHGLVVSGKVRYLGASSMPAWQFSKLIHTARASGLSPFVSMQSHYNAAYREEEREMIPLCLDEDVAVLPWSPLARGILARPWGETDTRSAADDFQRVLYGDIDRATVDAVSALAGERGVPMAQIALSWLMGRPGVVAPVIGATETAHVDAALAALRSPLTPDETQRIDETYAVHPIAGTEVLPFSPRPNEQA